MREFETLLALLAEHDFGAVGIGAARFLIVDDVAAVMLHHEIGRFHVGVSARPGAVPILTGEVRHFARLVVVPIGVVQLIGYLRAGLGLSEGEVVHRVVRRGRVFVRLGESGVAVRVHAVARVVTLAGKDVVEGVMRAVAHGEPIGALFHDVRFCVVGVVAGELLEIHFEIDGLGSARLEHARLFERQQLHRALFDEVLLVVLGVRRLSVDLHGGLARGAARVGDGHRELGVHRMAAATIEGHVAHGVSEARVAESVTEGERDVVRVIPLRVVVGHVDVAGAHALRARARALVDDRVVVTGLVVVRAGVDALRLDDVVREAGVGTARAHAGGVGALDLVRVGQLVVAEVHHRGIGRGVGRVGVVQSARRIGLAEEQVGDGFRAVRGGQTYVHHRIDAFVRLKLVELHGGNGVDEHDHLFGVLLGELD